MNARELALDVFLEMEKNAASPVRLIGDTLEKYDYEDPREKAFFKRLCEQTLEERIAIDWALDQYSKTPVSKMKPLIRALLRLSACQILYMDGVPDSAVCNEAVKLAKKRGFSSLSGFVNGVLRTLSRQKGQIRLPDEHTEPALFLSVRYNMPRWLVELWEEQYGPETARRILSGLSERRPVTIRFQNAWQDGGRQAAEAAEAIRRSGVGMTEHPLWPGAWELGDFEGVAGLPGYREGLFYAQDVSSMLAVAAAGILPGMRVLDLCSAPGGKALLAAEYAGKDGVVRAGDLSEKRLERLRENASRMGVFNLEIDRWDACVYREEQKEWADVMLADVPCSGLGVLGRKKDIRYRLKMEDLTALSVLQHRILSASWRYVKKGGILLYSTCTVNRQENEEIVLRFIQDCPFVLESLEEFLPACLCGQAARSGMLQLLPGEWHTDGFFMARLRRIG